MATQTAEEIRNEALAACGYRRGAMWTNMFSETQWAVLEHLARRCAAAEARLEAVREYAQLCADEEGDEGVCHAGKTMLRILRGEE